MAGKSGMIGQRFLLVQLILENPGKPTRQPSSRRWTPSYSDAGLYLETY